MRIGFSIPNGGAIATRRDRRRQVHDTHAGDLRNKYLAAVHVLDRADDKPNSLLQRHPEARHADVGDGHRSRVPLGAKQRNYAASASEHIPVTYTTKSRGPAPL